MSETDPFFQAALIDTQSDTNSLPLSQAYQEWIGLRSNYNLMNQSSS